MRQRKWNGRWLVVGMVVLLGIGAGLLYGLRPLAKMRVPRVTPPSRQTGAAEVARPAVGGGQDFIDGDGSATCPAEFPIKVNQRSGIYHLPGDLAYERTNPTYCYRSPEAAERDGYRHAYR